MKTQRKKQAEASAVDAKPVPKAEGVQVGVVLDPDLVEKVNTFCRKSGMSLDYLAACALRDYLKYNQWMALTDEEDEAQFNALGRYAFAKSMEALEKQEHEGS